MGNYNSEKFQGMLDEVLFSDKTVRMILQEIYEKATSDKEMADIYMKEAMEFMKGKNPEISLLEVITTYMKHKKEFTDQMIKLIAEINKLLSTAKEEIVDENSKNLVNDNDKLSWLKEDSSNNVFNLQGQKIVSN